MHPTPDSWIAPFVGVGRGWVARGGGQIDDRQTDNKLSRSDPPSNAPRDEIGYILGFIDILGYIYIYIYIYTGVYIYILGYIYTLGYIRLPWGV